MPCVEGHIFKHLQYSGSTFFTYLYKKLTTQMQDHVVCYWPLGLYMCIAGWCWMVLAVFSPHKKNLFSVQTRVNPAPGLQAQQFVFLLMIMDPSCFSSFVLHTPNIHTKSSNKEIIFYFKTVTQNTRNNKQNFKNSFCVLSAVQKEVQWVLQAQSHR